QGRLRNLLIVAETALSLVLLVGAGLLIRTFSNLMRTDPGFATKGVLSGQIWLTGTRYDTPTSISAYYDRLTGALTALPGVESAAVVEAGLPLQRGGNLGVFVGGDFKASADYRTITPGYFDVLKVPLTAGRRFSAADREGAEPVAIVNQTFAHRVLGEGDPLGQLIKLGGGSDAPRRVVGVVRDVRSFIGFPAPPTAFIPSAQTPVDFTRIYSSWFPTHVVLRTAGDPDALSLLLAKTIRETDPQVPVGRIRSMSSVLGESLAFQRFLMLLLTLFAGLAIVLAAVGLYGVMSYLVTQRTGEIGIRMALGARGAEVRRMVLGRGLRLTGLGVGAGLIGAAGLTRLLGSQLYGVEALDPGTFGLVAAVLLGVGLLACYLPARRATLVDPIVALKNE
ncbi:MAG TPA: ABC transporter permease, partial [Gemmatimonadales bacterium]|nr:ABC transporter permease [Gemmatimonadales bacterium]